MRIVYTKYLWTIIIILSLFSIVLIYSSTSSLATRSGISEEFYALKHTALIALSMFLTYSIQNVHYKYYWRTSRLVLLLSILLLFLTEITGYSYNDASRWLYIPSINHPFQPSEFARLALIVSLVSMVSKRQDTIKNNKSVRIIVFWIALVCLLIGISDWSNSMLLFINSIIILFIGRTPVKKNPFNTSIYCLAYGITNLYSRPEKSYCKE